MNYLDTHLFPEHEPVGRTITNCLGSREVVVLPKGYWDYLDFLAQEGYDIREWVKKVDRKRPSDKSLGEFLMERIWIDECERYRQGKPCPPSSPPEGYQE